MRIGLERSVRFDALAGVDDATLGGLAAVSRVVHEAGIVSLYTGDVPATIGALLAYTEARGVEPQNLMVRRATLEDVFLDLTGRALRD